MSRIHDALRRAELERAGRPTAPVEQKTAELPESPGTLPVNTVATDSEIPLLSVSGEAPGAGNRLTVEGLKTSVRRFKWNPNPKTTLFFADETYAAGTEEFRTLRSRLYALRDLQPLRTVLVSSASPGEGKSFISNNLAQIIVQQPHQRVLLIDGDLRWSRLHLSLGTHSTPGLSEFLGGEASELAVMQRGPLENLYFIPGGKHASNPSELIANGLLKDLLRRVSPLFDWVIIDSPPAMAVSDPRVMAEMCDGVLLVVAAGLSPFDLVQKTKQQFNDKRLLGVVLNRAEPRNSYSYKYYGYYREPANDGKGNGTRRG